MQGGIVCLFFFLWGPDTKFESWSCCSFPESIVPQRKGIFVFLSPGISLSSGKRSHQINHCEQVSPTSWVWRDESLRGSDFHLFLATLTAVLPFSTFWMLDAFQNLLCNSAVYFYFIRTLTLTENPILWAVSFLAKHVSCTVSSEKARDKNQIWLQQYDLSVLPNPKCICI